MSEVCVLGTAAWDHVFEVDHLPVADTQSTAQSLGRRPGGSSGNVARGLASAGHAVHLITHAGLEDLGDALMIELASYGVDTTEVLRSGRCTPETLIFVDGAGERAIVVLDKGFAETVPVPDKAITEAEALYVGRFADYGPQLPGILRKSRGLIVTASPPLNGTPGDWCADIVIGSATEFPAEWRDQPYELLRKRVGDRLRWVVITHGALGAKAYNSDSVIAIPAIESSVIDATGAGDSFACGLIHGLLQSKDIAIAGALGAYWAATAVTLTQSVPPRWEELQLGAVDGDWAKRLAFGRDDSL